MDLLSPLRRALDSSTATSRYVDCSLQWLAGLALTTSIYAGVLYVHIDA